ncbi:hypothetical protein K1W54_14810 [Micromonospora sp. CPCC 205371]|nr:hypothetical protein [Micromonospora sp. CPCC 205371]
MNDASLVVAVISTLISSLALAGVMVSLLLQVRQLQVNRLQAFRVTHAELIKMALDDPTLFADPADTLAPDSESSRRNGFLNWHMQHFQFGYVIGAFNESGLRAQTSLLFAVPSRRDWWKLVRDYYRIEATTRRERRFFEIVDEEYSRLLVSAMPAPSRARPLA